MFLQSIRWRLQLWHQVILLVVLSGFGFTAYQLQKATEFRRVDQEVQQRLGSIADFFRRPPPGERNGPGGPRWPGDRPPGGGPRDSFRPEPPPRGGGEDNNGPRREFRIPPNRASLFEGETNAFYYVAWSREGQEIGRSASAPAGLTKPERVGESSLSAARTRGSFREWMMFTPPGDCLIVGRSIATELENLQHTAVWLSGLGAGILALGWIGGWWLATRAIRPIHDISAAATQIANGDLSHRINTAVTDDELGQLARILNSTFSRLDSAFQRQRQFTADASHELRTPISVILSQTQAILARARTPEEYRGALEACQRAAQRMRSLIESLLILARLDEGQESKTNDPFDAARTTQECLEALGVLATEKGITLHSTLESCPCQGDAMRFHQVATNLIANAILHNKPGGEVTITLRPTDGFAMLQVADNGPGIPAADLPRIFERFYRVDESRSRGTHPGGTGLGLAISKGITESEGGSIEAASTEGQGATFTLRWPQKRPEVSAASRQGPH